MAYDTKHPQARAAMLDIGPARERIIDGTATAADWERLATEHDRRNNHLRASPASVRRTEQRLARHARAEAETRA